MNPETSPSTPVARTWKRKWYTYPFVNPRLQMGMTFVPLLAGAIIAIYFSYLLYLYSIEAFSQLTEWFPEKAPTDDVLGKLKSMWIKATAFIVLFELLILPILGLFFSHRLAGPLLVITKRLGDIKNGKFPALIRLRKGSFLQDFAEDFNASMSYLKNRDQDTKKKLSDAMALLDRDQKSEARDILASLAADTFYSSSEAGESASS